VTHIQHLIIAGSNKCGTTSLFRYLSDHPEVSGSMHKETGFFHHDYDYENSETLSNYMKLFPDLKDQHRFCVEATPTYLDSGNVTISRIDQLIDKPQVLLLLRDPADRLVSYYRSKQGLESSLIYGLSFDEFVDKALAIASQKESASTEQERRIGLQIEKACYAQYLSEFLKKVPAERLHVMFFENLRDTPLSTLQSLCNAIDLNSHFYDDYVFRVENRSRFHRNAKLRTLASKINAASEPVLNRLPIMRRWLRSVYNTVNTVPGKGQSFDDQTIRRLREYFQPHNEALGTLLKQEFHIEAFPEWLSAE
jgi:hypothetical protein